MVSKNLVMRILSSIGIFVIFCGSLYFNSILFYLLVILLTMLSSFELFSITKGDKMVYFFGIIVIIIPYFSLMYIHCLDHGNIILMWLFFSIWFVDIFAYFVGRSFNGLKIMPIISPNKSWSGLFGGILSSISISVIFSIIFGMFFIVHSVIIGFIVAILAQLGDFFESAIKRYCKVKDSSNIIPGHGGVLDRMDGFIFTSPVVALYIESISKFFK